MLEVRPPSLLWLRGYLVVRLRGLLQSNIEHLGDLSGGNSVMPTIIDGLLGNHWRGSLSLNQLGSGYGGHHL